MASGAAVLELGASSLTRKVIPLAPVGMPLAPGGMPLEIGDAPLAPGGRASASSAARWALQFAAASADTPPVLGLVAAGWPPIGSRTIAGHGEGAPGLP